MTSRSRRLLGASLSVFALSGLAFSGIAAAQEPISSGTTAANTGAIMARLSLADGTDVGTATFRAMRAGVHVEVDFTSLPVGPHGIHIHETGACAPDFDAAGGHLAPDGHEHGFAQTEDPHPGDLPNIWVNDDGAVRAEFLNWRLSLDDLLDGDGSAVIVHEAADTYMDPASAGARIACGVVEQLS